MSKTVKRLIIIIPAGEEDRAITRAAKNDPDAQPLTIKQLKAMVSIAKLATSHGRSKLENPK